MEVTKALLRILPVSPLRESEREIGDFWCPVSRNGGESETAADCQVRNLVVAQ